MPRHKCIPQDPKWGSCHHIQAKFGCCAVGQPAVSAVHDCCASCEVFKTSFVWQQQLGVAFMQALLRTSSQQKVAKRYEDVAAGRYKIKAAASVLDVELQAAADKQQQIVMSVRASMQQVPELQPALERILLRASAAAQ